MDTGKSSNEHLQFPISSPRRMPCKHWQQFPIRRDCVDCLDDYCNKCRFQLPLYKPEEKNLWYQHDRQFYEFIHQNPTAVCLK